MYDLTNKLVDCSELTDMVGGEQIFEMIKTMCDGEDNGEWARFEDMIKYGFLTVSIGGIFMFCKRLGPSHVNIEIIKPVDVVGEVRMNAAKDGATLVIPSDSIPGSYVDTVYYWSNGPDVKLVGYKTVETEIPEGTERIFTDGDKKTFMKLGPNFEIQVYLTPSWLTPVDQHGTARMWGRAKKTMGSPTLDLDVKILTENFGDIVKGEELSEPNNISAQDIIKAGLGHISDRAVTYDKPEGERSMASTVQAFNTVTGHNLTEEQGWHFMTLLKIVRSQQGDFKVDNYEDGSAYFGLAGEAASKERNDETK